MDSAESSKTAMFYVCKTETAHAGISASHNIK